VIVVEVAIVEAMWDKKARAHWAQRKAPRMLKKRTIALLMVVFVGLDLAQSTKPDLSGIWRSIDITRGPVVDSRLEIKQSQSTFAIRYLIENSRATDWHTYPTDGTVLKTRGRNHTENTGRWQANTLVLESKGPGNAPWRRSTMRQIISLSENGRMTISFHELSDKHSVHDYAVVFERIK
jgi:hypothetical protein